MPPKKGKERASATAIAEDVEPEHHPSWETVRQQWITFHAICMGKGVMHGLANTGVSERNMGETTERAAG